MPTVICTGCNKTGRWSNRRGARLRDIRCDCGGTLRRAKWVGDGYKPVESTGRSFQATAVQRAQRRLSELATKFGYSLEEMRSVAKIAPYRGYRFSSVGVATPRGSERISGKPVTRSMAAALAWWSKATGLPIQEEWV